MEKRKTIITLKKPMVKKVNREKEIPSNPQLLEEEFENKNEYLDDELPQEFVDGDKWDVQSELSENKPPLTRRALLCKELSSYVNAIHEKKLHEVNFMYLQFFQLYEKEEYKQDPDDNKIYPTSYGLSITPTKNTFDHLKLGAIFNGKRDTYYFCNLSKLVFPDRLISFIELLMELSSKYFDDQASEFKWDTYYSIDEKFSSRIAKMLKAHEYELPEYDDVKILQSKGRKFGLRFTCSYEKGYAISLNFRPGQFNVMVKAGQGYPEAYYPTIRSGSELYLKAKMVYEAL